MTTRSGRRPSVGTGPASTRIGSAICHPVAGPLGSFRGRQHLVVPAGRSSGDYEITLSLKVAVAPYAVRIISSYDDGRRLASDEVKVESASHRLRDLIGSEIVEPHQDSQPWLRDTWRFVNSPRFSLDASRYWGAKVYRGSSNSKDELDLVYATSLKITVTTPDHFSPRHTVPVIIHELAMSIPILAGSQKLEHQLSGLAIFTWPSCGGNMETKPTGQVNVHPTNCMRT